MNSNQTTLFSVANFMYREGNIKDACLIYELLAENSPDFQCYSESEKLAKLMAGIKENSKIHIKKSSNFQRRLCVSNLALNHGLHNLIESCFEGYTLPNPELHLARANIYFNSDKERWLKLLNKYLLFFDLSPLVFKASKANSNKELFLNVTSPKLNSVNGPLVTVCMSCYNAEKYIEHAVRSIINQTYKNVELLIFNDKSIDNSLSILKRLAKEDDRVKIFDNKVNQGTYVNRNHAFQMAKGDYFTILDADDFALPQRIELQVRQLEKNPNHVGLTNEWIRLFIDGKIHYRSWLGGCYQHESVATMMIRTHICREKAGYWDSVRFAADTEFQHRLYRLFGNDKLPLIKIPTVLSLYHESSLTNDPTTGINTINSGLSPTRIEYRKSWKDWHGSTDNKDLYIKFPQSERPFEAPINML
ncbi:glycosyltransferase family 2 protein [Limnohabitans sp.]|uniref:glycosyltransferase family 2 protein n=1 Tax=Limnohabitans sp. TaxID=1907725 RepID=UPI0039BC7D46